MKTLSYKDLISDPNFREEVDASLEKIFVLSQKIENAINTLTRYDKIICQYLYLNNIEVRRHSYGCIPGDNACVDIQSLDLSSFGETITKESLKKTFSQESFRAYYFSVSSRIQKRECSTFFSFYEVTPYLLRDLLRNTFRTFTRERRFVALPFFSAKYQQYSISSYYTERRSKIKAYLCAHKILYNNMLRNYCASIIAMEYNKSEQNIYPIIKAISHYEMQSFFIFILCMNTPELDKSQYSYIYLRKIDTASAYRLNLDGNPIMTILSPSSTSTNTEHNSLRELLSSREVLWLRSKNIPVSDEELSLFNYSRTYSFRTI